MSKGNGWKYENRKWINRSGQETLAFSNSLSLPLFLSFSESAKWTAVPGCPARTDKTHVRGRVSTSRDSIQPPYGLWFSAVLSVAEYAMPRLNLVMGLKWSTTSGFGEFQQHAPRRGMTSKNISIKCLKSDQRVWNLKQKETVHTLSSVWCNRTQIMRMVHII